MMAVNDIIEWPVAFSPVEAKIECRPVDIKRVSNAMLPDSAAILGVNDAGVWIRSEACRQGTHAYCPAEAFPKFECSSAGAVAVSPSQVSTLRSATLSTDPDYVSVALHGDRLMMEANGFGGTVPTVAPTSDTHRHVKVAGFDLRAIHDRHTAEARITDCQFEEFLDCNADSPDVQVTLTPDGTAVTTRARHAHWSWGESTGSGTATYRGQEFLDVFAQFSSVESTPRFTWGEDETAAMIFQADGWYAIGYAIPVQDSPPETAWCHEESATATRHCRECGSQLERDPDTGNWTCQSPKCGFRAITLE